MNNEAAEQLEDLPKIENPSTPEEVLDTRSAQEIEAALLKETEEAALKSIGKMAPEDLATQFFEMFHPLFVDKVHGLTAKGAKEALHALIQWPLKNEKPEFKTKVAEAVFNLGTRLLDAKYIIIQAAQMDEKIRLDKKKEMSDNINNTEVQEVLNNVETSFIQGEEVNG